MTISETQAQLEAIQHSLEGLVREVQTVIVGQDEVLRSIITCLLAGGHGLLEGVPGLGKTLMIRTLASAVDLSFTRIQFTPDLMPADIVGTSVLVDRPDGGRELSFQPGPIFANICLADEINRATPKTQSALLEAMAEGQVTAGGKTRPLPEPFLVLATQNPLEMEGTYPLPEAQLDRFMFKIDVPFPANRSSCRSSSAPPAPATTSPRASSPAPSCCRCVRSCGRSPSPRRSAATSSACSGPPTRTTPTPPTSSSATSASAAARAAPRPSCSPPASAASFKAARPRRSTMSAPSPPRPCATA